MKFNRRKRRERRGSFCFLATNCTNFHELQSEEEEKKKVTQRAQRTTEIREAGKTLLVFTQTNDFLLKPFEQKETKMTKICFPLKP